MKTENQAAPVGRPRDFDEEVALGRAMELFWRKGYEGTSLAELTEVMDINKPSLYAAFGNKASLFRKALDRYEGERAGAAIEALSEPVVRDAIEQLLYVTIDSQTDPKTPPGCLVVQGALPNGEKGDLVAQELVKRRMATQNAIRQRLEKAKSEGDLPAGTKPAELARFVFTVIAGLAAQARDGASREELRRVAVQAMKAWPE
jgi:AcrR family transcriptional regulator